MKSTNKLERIKVSKINTAGLIHKWANLLIPEDQEITKGRYYFTNTSIHYGNTLVAEHVEKFTVVYPFKAGGSFGSGFSNRSIIRALPPNRKIVGLNENKSYIHYRSHLISLISSNYYLQCLALVKEIETNNKIQYIPISKNISLDDRDIRNYMELLVSRKICSKWGINRVLITPIGDVTYTKYNGWSRYNSTCYTHKVKSTYYDYLKLDIHDFIEKEFGKDTLNEVNFRHWRFGFKTKDGFPSYLGNIHRSREIYNNPELKARFEKETLEALEAKRLQQIEKTFQSDRNEVLDFLNNKRNRTYMSYHFIRLESDKDRVLTSLGVKVTLEEAKQLYRLLKVLIPKVIEGTLEKVPDNVKIQGFTLNNIVLERTKSYITEEMCENHPIIKIGCHSIPWYAIEYFIEINNFDW